MSQRATRHGKPHCEAFPAIDVLAVERSHRAGGTICEWRDEQDCIVGYGALLAYDDCEMILDYRFSGSANIARCTGVLHTQISGSRRNPQNVRNSFHCPTCSNPAQKLFFVAEAWACRSCHSLVYLSQRLGPVNKKLLERDRIQKELASAPAKKVATRQFHNRQRHVERLSRELAGEAFAALPQELLFRTSAQWQGPQAVMPADTVRGIDGLVEHAPALAYFQPRHVFEEPAQACELVGIVVLDRPATRFLGAHKAQHFIALEQDLCRASSASRRLTPQMLADMLAERIILRPLALTSEWSDMVETVNGEGRRECAISARYEGDPTLWRIGPGARPARQPLRVILDDNEVTLKVRLPMTGFAMPQAALKVAVAKLQDRLARVRATFEAFNTTRHEAALRRVRYDLVHKRPGSLLRLLR